MTDEEFEAQVVRIDKLVEKWAPLLGLKWMENLQIRFHRHFKEGDDRCIADNVTDWEYKLASITFYIPACEDVPDDRLERLVVHELFHTVVNPLREQEKHKLEELVVTNLTQIVFWVKTAAIEEGRRLERKRIKVEGLGKVEKSTKPKGKKNKS